MDNIDKSKYPPPENWLFTEARRLFVTPEVTSASEIELKWEKPDEEALVAYMCGEKGFAEDRIRNGCKKLDKARGGATQGRLDSFFKVFDFNRTKFFEILRLLSRAFYYTFHLHCNFH